MKRNVFPLLVLLLAAVCAAADDPPRPNILWLTSEDNGPQLGCYGDAFAQTPILDQLAARGLIYDCCWSNAPVCAPARTAIISGLYPTSTGAEHMRSMTQLPAGMQMFPQLLRVVGYYCTNNSKEDYNLQKPGQVWDDSSKRAHWKNRQPGQPFFAVFNIIDTHESQIRKRPHAAVHDPSRVRVPAYHPDTPEVRQDWAQYYDQMTIMDRLMGERLQELVDAGLADDTIVFYYGDHGPGMPRCKRWPYDSGLHVPLIVSIPDKFAQLRPAEYTAGGRSTRLVSFVDLAPTVLSLAGVKPPDTYQGHAFAGAFTSPAPRHVFGFRGRMDERYDLVRTVRDARYIYIRNFMPHRIYGQYVDYMFQTPTTRVWSQLYKAGRLQPPLTYFWESKPTEELYDLQTDPDEVHDLAASAEHQAVRERLRRALRDQVFLVRDVGLIPEDEMHRRAGARSPYELGHDPAAYPLERVWAAAIWASSAAGTRDASGRLSRQADGADVAVAQQWLEDGDSAVRYWGTVGALVRGAPCVGAEPVRTRLERALHDASPSVRIGAAEALARFGPRDVRAAALRVLVDCADGRREGLFAAVAALNSLDALGPIAASIHDEIRELPTSLPGIDNRNREYLPKLIEHFVQGP